MHAGRDTRKTSLLLSHLRARDPQAGDMLAAMFHAPLHRFCWGYLHHADDAEDAAQEILMKVLRHVDPPDHFRPWLFRIARNHCLNVVRDRSRRLDRARAAAEPVETWAGILTRLARSERGVEVRRLLERLTPQQQEVLRLRYGDDLSREEIAEVLEIPVSVVKSRLYEGVKALRAQAAVLESI